VSGFHAVGRAAGPDDLPAVAACLTSAFYDDPVWGSWTFPDESSRTERLYELMHFWAQAAVRHSWVRMTENAEAVTVWLPPGEPEMTSNEEAAFGALLSSLVGARTQEVQALFDRFDEHHPNEPHFYLSLWATHRNHTGRGLGTALIHDCLAQIDTERMPAYLESTNPANVRRYETLGFRHLAEFNPEDGPVISTMWRDAV
jgi:ribosomal protein S18 acetylase RimI-like enzyme